MSPPGDNPWPVVLLWSFSCSATFLRAMGREVKTPSTGVFDMISPDVLSDERCWFWANLAMLALTSLILVVFMTV
jgi:hypothetical protein